jgi:hypothetical protein
LWAPELLGFLDELPPEDRLLPAEERELPPEDRLLLPAEERELPPEDRLLPADERELLPVDRELPTEPVRGAEYRPELPPTEPCEREVEPRYADDPDGDVVGRL